jgi:hypothetical protein
VNEATRLTDADRLIIDKARGHAALRGGAALRAHAETDDTTAAMIIAIGEAQHLLAELVAIIDRLDGHGDG